jgi:hypothetical protein
VGEIEISGRSARHSPRSPVAQSYRHREKSSLEEVLPQAEDRR